MIQFSVIDTGIGIAPENQKKLFQPFIQLDSSLSRQFEGTGLGLALVQKLTELHGGSIHVESEVGKGSCFTINLRCTEERLESSDTAHPESQSPAHDEKSGDPSPSSTKRAGVILLAEDTSSNILTIRDYLENHHYAVIVAHNGVEALEQAAQTQPDLILMDIQMPLMDGLETTRRLRADPRFTSTPIIALTALAMPGDRERCVEAGANEYMSKPVKLKKLVQLIQSLLQQDGTD